MGLGLGGYSGVFFLMGWYNMVWVWIDGCLCFWVGVGLGCLFVGSFGLFLGWVVLGWGLRIICLFCGLGFG